MLQGATAATAKMSAGRVDAAITRFEHIDDMSDSAVAALPAGSYPQLVPGRGEWNIEPVTRLKRGYSIAAGAQSLDRDF